MRCCGAPSHQTIVVRAGVGRLALLRCSSCEGQRWARDGVPVDRAAALAELAHAFQDRPAEARAARVRAAAATAARAVQRTRATAPAAAPESPDLTGLLAGWQVLGASS